MLSFAYFIDICEIFVYSLHIFFKIPGEQDSEAVKPGKKTLETVKGVGVFLAFFCLS